MKRISIFLFGCLFLLKANSQSNFFKRIDYSILDTSSNLVLHYTLTKYCNENIENFISVAPVIQKKREHFKLILFLDTAIKKNENINNLISLINPDIIIPLNYDFQGCLYTKKELKKFTKDFENMYHVKTSILGPTTTFIVGKNKLEIFSVDNIDKKIDSL